jgi:hypothetical protein
MVWPEGAHEGGDPGSAVELIRDDLHQDRRGILRNALTQRGDVLQRDVEYLRVLLQRVDKSGQFHRRR